MIKYAESRLNTALALYFQSTTQHIARDRSEIFKSSYAWGDRPILDRQLF